MPPTRPGSPAAASGAAGNQGFGPGKADVVGDLADRLSIRHHSAVGLIDRLLSKSLVKRQPSAQDRRQVLLALTPKADRLLARLSTAHRDELQRLSPLLQTLLTHFKPKG